MKPSSLPTNNRHFFPSQASFAFAGLRASSSTICDVSSHPFLFIFLKGAGLFLPSPDSSLLFCRVCSLLLFEEFLVIFVFPPHLLVVYLFGKGGETS
jgi:hypothetical protein